MSNAISVNPLLQSLSTQTPTASQHLNSTKTPATENFKKIMDQARHRASDQATTHRDKKVKGIPVKQESVANTKAARDKFSFGESDKPIDASKVKTERKVVQETVTQSSSDSSQSGAVGKSKNQSELTSEKAVAVKDLSNDQAGNPSVQGVSGENVGVTPEDLVFVDPNAQMVDNATSLFSDVNSNPVQNNSVSVINAEGVTVENSAEDLQEPSLDVEDISLQETEDVTAQARSGTSSPTLTNGVAPEVNESTILSSTDQVGMLAQGELSQVLTSDIEKKPDADSSQAPLTSAVDSPSLLQQENAVTEFQMAGLAVSQPANSPDLIASADAFDDGLSSTTTINPDASSKNTTASNVLLGASQEENTLMANTLAESTASKINIEKANAAVQALVQGNDPIKVAGASSTAIADNSSFQNAFSLASAVSESAPSNRSFVVQTSVPVPVGQPQWSQAVGEKVLWLAAQNVSSAEIHLHPKDLGPLQVNVTVNQDQTSVSFTSHHAAVREVLDQNLGRLRDMFTEQGLNLVNVDVSDKSFARQQGEGKSGKGGAQQGSEPMEEDAPIAVSSIIQKRLVDHYA